ncbi:ATP-dependent DNA helicase 2 subunit KU70 [Euphorbia peplus]|nr:ATP-dependent DNA helicase 2 subunit KU70 [Euphorbia peplus]
MELDPDDVFKDDDDDPDSDFFQLTESSKEFIVYLVDASPKMFNATIPGEDGKDETHFHVAVSCILESLKSRIINTSYDEVAICFFNTREKKNLQDLNGVFVFSVAEREYLDRPTARFIKDFERIEESFMKDIGSQYGIVSGSRENSLYNALWVAQALLRKGSAKTADKRMLLLTNEDDPFGILKGAARTDMTRTTVQRAKDAKDLGISIELLPLSRPDEEFNVSLFYAELIGLEGDDVGQFMPSAGQKLEEMKDQLRKRMLTKRIVRRITFVIASGLSIQLNSYALIRPTAPGAITWLDSITNRPLKTERSLICSDTGALMHEASKLSHPYINENIKFSAEELAEIKRVSMGNLRLIGFKPLHCLKDYHNLKPATFLYPTDKEVVGSTSIFIALHKSMMRFHRFAVAFYGTTSNSRLVALVAQDEIITGGGQVEPPGMHMIYLPFTDDVRDPEELDVESNIGAPHATDDQIKNAAALIKRMDLKDFSVSQFTNPALQRHYAILQALALEEEDIPETRDETLPDEEGMARPKLVKAVEDFKLSVYGEYQDEEIVATNAPRKRKAANDAPKKRKAANVPTGYDLNWDEIAENGQLKDLTVPQLMSYLTSKGLDRTGKKEVLINRIITHMEDLERHKTAINR